MSQAKQDPANIRNIAIIAHVDHGKTTLVDGLLKQSKTFRDNQAEMQQELIMDSADQERERGITITAKVTAVQHGPYRINIVDTPGHADFSGEVERTLNMADGCLLIVDAQEGVMPQTKFVLRKALAHGLKILVVLNKIDKIGARIEEVESELEDLFLDLATDEEQLHYPIYYAVGRMGKAWAKPPGSFEEEADLSVLFDAIISEVPAPKVELEAPFQMLVSALAWDSYKGRFAIGRITRGHVRAGDSIAVCEKDNKVTKARVNHVLMSHGVSRFEVEEGIAGDIVQISGVEKVNIGDTLTDSEHPEALPSMEVEAPTLKIYFGPNTSPFKGQEGQFSTSRQIGDRLNKELEIDLGLRVESSGIGYLVSGRGELHLSVLIETMRREGFEFEVGRPVVITKEVDGKVHEPIEELTIEVPQEYVGAVQMELGARRANLLNQYSHSQELTRLVYELPTRALLGLRNILLTNTRGSIVMNSLTIGHQPMGAALKQLRNGVLVACEQGTTTPYALSSAEERGVCFLGPGEKVYVGQVVGLNSRSGDIDINVCREKKLTNVRSSGSDGIIQLTPPTRYSLEECLDFIEDDELLEVTPENLRLRKKELNPSFRKTKKSQK